MSEIHRLQVRIHDWGHVELKLLCDDHESALCHLTCAEGCETWASTDHVMPGRENGVEEGHRLNWRPVCNAVEWLDAVGAEECYAGPSDVSLHDGMAVTVTWDGDNYVWSVNND